MFNTAISFSKDDIAVLRSSLGAFSFDAPISSIDIVTQRYLSFYGFDALASQPKVSHHFGAIEATSDFEKLACHYFKHDNAKALCFILHGYFDHAGLYVRLIQYLLSQEFSVVICDLPGHGLSAGAPGAIDTFTQYSDAFQSCFAIFGNVHLPKFIVAQSTGGSVAMNWMHKSGSADVESAILLAPLVRPVSWRASVMLLSIAKLFRLSKVSRKFNHSTHDVTFHNFIINDDPLQVDFVSVSWVNALKGWIKSFLAFAEDEHTQVLVIQGDQDTTVDWRYNISMVRKKFLNSDVHIVPDALHHLVNEEDAIRADVFSRIAGYFERQL